MTAMTTHTDQLPGRESAALKWTAGLLPGCGVLEVTDRRVAVVYVVNEIPGTDGFDGRSFRLAKLPGTPGSDPEAENYDVRCARVGADHRCECKGFLRWGGACKHLAAMLWVLTNRWV